MSELHKAIIKFQSEMKPVIKESENPHFRSKFADLSSILSDVLPLLTKNKLGVLQLIRSEAGANVMVTKLIHESGDSIESSIAIPAQSDPQKLGSLITYLKRYSLQAMLGIATEDDDGNSASDAPAYKSQPSNNRADDPASFTQKKHWDELAALATQKGIAKAPFAKTIADYHEAKKQLLAMPDKR